MAQEDFENGESGLSVRTKVTNNFTQLFPLKNYAGTGIVSGCTISINTDTTKIDISSGVGYIVDNSNPTTPILTKMIYAGQTAIAITNIAIANATYIAINSSGTVVQQITEYTPIQRRSLLIIGVVIHSNRTVINVVNNLPDVILDEIAQYNDLLDALKNFNITGNKITANGTNLNINKSIGYIFKKGCNFVNDPLNPHTLQLAALTAPSNLRYRLQNGTEYTNTSIVDPDYYDLAGVKTSVTPNKYTIQRFTLFPSNLIRIQYGQALYNSKAEAIQAIRTEIFITEQNIADNGLLRALLVIKKGTTNLSNLTDAEFFEVDRFGSIQSSSSGSGTTTLLQAYTNSSQPQITTTTSLGDFQIKRGSDADTDLVFSILNGAGSNKANIKGTGDTLLNSLSLLKTIIASGNTGNRTIDTPIGRTNIAAGQTSVTITNSFVTSNSIIVATCATNDSTAYVKNTIASTGQFVINLGAAATAETAVNFIVFN